MHFKTKVNSVRKIFYNNLTQIYFHVTMRSTYEKGYSMTLQTTLLKEYTPPQTNLEQPYSFSPSIQPSARLIQKLTKEIRKLAELSMALYVLHASENLQGAHISLKERKASERALNKYFHFYCPHLPRQISNIEVHVLMQSVLDEHKPCFSKYEMQALHHIYRKWETMPTATLTQQKNRAWIERGLKVIMSSNAYREALPKKRISNRSSR